MKQRCYTIAILLGISQMLSAYTHLASEKHHFLYVDAAAGYASLYNTSNVIKSGVGSAVEIGIGYRFSCNYFLTSIGMEGYYRYNTHSMERERLQLNLKDTEGTPFVLTADATRGKDVCRSIAMNIPLLFGIEYRRFYGLVGPKLSCNLWGQTRTDATLTTNGQYDRYIGVFEEMPNHTFYTRAITSGTQSLSWNMDVLAHIEIGARIGPAYFTTGGDVPKPKQRYYISLYADYGLLNIRDRQSKGERLGYQETEKDGIVFYTTPALLCKELENASVKQYSFGIKATILFELPQQRPCVICKD